MNTAAARRPMGCLKALMRQTRQQRALRRLTTAAASPAEHQGGVSRRRRRGQERASRFQVWPQIPSIRSTHPDPMPALRQQQIAALDPTGAWTRLFARERGEGAKVGDVLMVTTKAGEPFAGVFIQIRRRGIDTAIQLRGQLMKTGVEMWFKVYSPTVTAIDIIWRRPKRARRARLTYMRKPKHDMGSVDQLVSAWKRQKYAPRSAASQKAAGRRGKK